MSIALIHPRYHIVETLRVPIAVLSTAVFPALSLLFFVVPFDYAANPVAATTAVAQLTVFAVMSSFLFTYGVGVADDRERSWDPYLRTLPAPAWPRIMGRLLTGMAFAVLAVVPVLLLGALATAATASLPQLVAGLAALAVAGLPFLFGGLAIGSCSWPGRWRRWRWPAGPTAATRAAASAERCCSCTGSQPGQHCYDPAVVVGRRRQPELAEDRRGVLLHRPLGHDQCPADRGVGAALGPSGPAPRALAGRARRAGRGGGVARRARTPPPGPALCPRRPPGPARRTGRPASQSGP